jgi:predicted 3-demethylubiquinone-9 3-methyltransferase (glyoxalase superfamily)
MDTMGKVKTYLTFKENGEEAVKLYASLIKNSKIHSIVRSEMDGPVPKGALLNASFVLDGQEFMALDGGPYFSFSEGISIYVDCETQEEIDRLWYALSAGGEEQMCGWLKDKYGVSWQIIPARLGEMMTDPDREKAQRVMEAMLQMKKFNIAALEQAYSTEPA